ncbi:hypothetical protein ACQP2P_38660 [Dactylosporangium sp. CA-139114]|uniref:hypothetical protein n=1 Tax=Dactylosporangium sp. CA-139114 TaxID=3239931 RepID=UPI003D9880E2
MNETWINIGSRAAVRLEIKQIGGQRGVGVVRLILGVELTNRGAEAERMRLSLRGRIEMLNVEGEGLAAHLADLVPFDRDADLAAIGSWDMISLAATIDDRQLQLIEEYRSGGLHLRISLAGHAMVDGSQLPIHINTIDYRVPQSEWLGLLEQIGYARRFLVELEVPDLRTDPALAEAIGYFADARRRFSEGDWRLTVEALRQSLAALVGKKPDEEDDAAEVQESFRELRRAQSARRVGYGERAEVVRKSLKFLCDLGAHPEAGELRRHEARSALMMTAGLLESYRAV